MIVYQRVTLNPRCQMFTPSPFLWANANDRIPMERIRWFCNGDQGGAQYHKILEGANLDMFVW